jgi:hypothetical protein
MIRTFREIYSETLIKDLLGANANRIVEAKKISYG